MLLYRLTNKSKLLQLILPQNQFSKNLNNDANQYIYLTETKIEWTGKEVKWIIMKNPHLQQHDVVSLSLCRLDLGLRHWNGRIVFDLVGVFSIKIFLFYGFGLTKNITGPVLFHFGLRFEGPITRNSSLEGVR